MPRSSLAASMTHGRLLFAASVTESSSCKASVMDCRLEESKRITARSHDARSAAPLPDAILSTSTELCSLRIKVAACSAAQNQLLQIGRASRNRSHACEV